MFDGVPEQLHQFIASSRTTLPLPSLSFSSLHHHHHHHHHQHGSPNPNTTTIFPTFDPFTSATNSSPQVPLQVQPSFLNPFTNQQSQPRKSGEEKQAANDSLVCMSNNLEIDIERSESNINPASWSNDEVLALLRIRSSLDNWFPGSTWEHVSRKLDEHGYKRSAEKCKEKFEEEESRYLNNINYNKSHRFFNELEDLYSNSTHGQNPDENSKNLEKPREEEEQQDKNLLDGLNGEETTKEKDQTLMNPLEDVREKSVASKGEKKRKRRKRVQQQKVKDDDDDDHHHHQFEMLKRFCEDIVKKMMVQQEEMHLKLIEDMVKRDEEKAAREEAWNKQEMDRVNKELEIRAHEQAIAGDRQATLIKFLKSFTSSSISSGSSSSHDHHHHQKQCFEDLRSSEGSPVEVLINNSASSSLILAQNPNDHQVANHGVQNPSSNLDNPKEPTSQNPNSPNINVTKKKPLSPTSVSTQINASSSDHRDGIGKRWPRDEVFALINLRCSRHNNGSDHHHNQDKEGQAKIPLWERISQGMLEMGYKRSAKRCKEKWENINKYFRKTKDVNKKRSLDSRTCPYFHQLSTLYNQGTLVAPSEAGSRPATLPENNSTPLEDHPGSDSTMHVGDDQQGEKILVQVPTFGFEF